MLSVFARFCKTMTYDVAIIGSGISAGPIVERLAGSSRKLRVIVIDRGPLPWPSVRWHSGGEHTTRPRWWTGDDPGGAARLWYGQVSRFAPSDFCKPEPWPIAPDAWHENYESIARTLTPYCADHLLHGRQAPSDGLSTPRTVLSHFERKIFDYLAGRNISAYSGQTCLGGHGWSALPVDPVSLNDLSLAAPHAHPRNWLWRIEKNCSAQPEFDRVTGVWVEALRPGTDRCEIIGQTKENEPWSISARNVVIASGVTETVRLLSTLPETKSALGTGFTLTTELTAYIQTDIRRQQADDLKIGRFAHISARFPFEPNKETGAQTGKFSFYDAVAFDTPKRLQQKLFSQRSAVPDLSPDGPLILKVSFKGQSQISPEKRIEVNSLYPTQLHYTPTAADRQLVVPSLMIT
jgi:hypothetical protein